MTREPFKIGDVVAVLGPFSHRATRIATVARVMKRFVELSDGTRYSLNGWPYPRARGFGANIVHATDAHREDAERAALLSTLAARCDTLDARAKLSTAKLRAIVAILRAPE